MTVFQPTPPCKAPRILYGYHSEDLPSFSKPYPNLLLSYPTATRRIDPDICLITETHFDAQEGGKLRENLISGSEFSNLSLHQSGGAGTLTVQLTHLQWRL